MIRMLYFAQVRERLGRGEEHVEPPPGVATLGALLDWLADTGEDHRAALEDRAGLRFAVNQDHAGEDMPVAEGDEVAIFPPVTGG